MHRLSAQPHIAQVDSGELFEENNTPLAPEVIESLTNFCSKYRETKNEQAIYFRAGINSNPMEAVKILCDVPEQYYRDRNIQPWFTIRIKNFVVHVGEHKS